MLRQLLSSTDLSKTGKTLSKVGLPLAFSQCCKHFETDVKQRFGNWQLSLYLYIFDTKYIIRLVSFNIQILLKREVITGKMQRRIL